MLCERELLGRQCILYRPLHTAFRDTQVDPQLLECSQSHMKSVEMLATQREEREEGDKTPRETAMNSSGS